MNLTEKRFYEVQNKIIKLYLLGNRSDNAEILMILKYLVTYPYSKTINTDIYDKYNINPYTNTINTYIYDKYIMNP